MNIFYKSNITVMIQNTPSIVRCRIVFHDVETIDDDKMKSLFDNIVTSTDFNSIPDDLYGKIPPDIRCNEISITVENDKKGCEKHYDRSSSSVNVITDASGNVKGIITNKLGSVNVISINSLDKDLQDKITQQLSPQEEVPKKEINAGVVKDSTLFNNSVKDVFSKIDNFCPSTDLIDDLPNSDDPKWIKIREQIAESKLAGEKNDTTTN